MRKLSEFLEKFKNLKPSNQAIEKEAQRIIKELINLPDSYYEVLFQKPDLVIFSCGSVIKNEIFINKEKILNKLKIKFSKSAPVNILFK